MLAKKLLTYQIYIVLALQTLLFALDSFPAFPSLLSIASHVVYLQNLRRFPTVRLSDPVFLLSCALVLANHWLWFRHFSDPPRRETERYNAYAYGARTDAYPSFTEIASFFGLCVWLVPFSLFVSLSASENVLPTMGSEYTPGVTDGKIATAAKGRQGMAKAAVDGVRQWVAETSELMGFTRGERTRHRF